MTSLLMEFLHISTIHLTSLYDNQTVDLITILRMCPSIGMQMSGKY